MALEFSDFVHPKHVGIFSAAAMHFRCHILVRQTGRASIRWICKAGYTGKRGDLKAKTADVDDGPQGVAGLVCSPFLRPEAFSPQRLPKARAEWQKSQHLLTYPPDGNGFADNSAYPRCLTPYLVQTRRDHRHYGCVALVEMGLLMPRYVHGDYDLYAIIPVGQRFDPAAVLFQQGTLLSSMTPAQLGLEQRLKMAVPNMESALSMQVSSFINVRIASTGADLLGGLMVNHGENIGMGAAGRTGEPVLAFLGEAVNRQSIQILYGPEDHERLYRSA